MNEQPTTATDISAPLNDRLAPDLTDWIDSQDLMQILHISPRTLHTLRKNGTLPYSRIGYKFYYNRYDVAEILKNNYTMYKIQMYGDTQKI